MAVRPEGANHQWLGNGHVWIPMGLKLIFLRTADSEA